MDDLILSEPARSQPAAPTPTQLHFVKSFTSTEPDGTPVEFEVHHNPVEL